MTDLPARAPILSSSIMIICLSIVYLQKPFYPPFFLNFLRKNFTILDFYNSSALQAYSKGSDPDPDQLQIQIIIRIVPHAVSKVSKSRINSAAVSTLTWNAGLWAMKTGSQAGFLQVSIALPAAVLTPAQLRGYSYK